MMDQRSLTILPIDDYLTVHDIFSIAIRHYGHTIFSVQDGESALNFLESYAPDLIIIDLFLSGTDGYDFLGRSNTARSTRAAQLSPLPLTIVLKRRAMSS